MAEYMVSHQQIGSFDKLQVGSPITIASDGSFMACSPGQASIGVVMSKKKDHAVVCLDSRFFQSEESQIIEALKRSSDIMHDLLKDIVWTAKEDEIIEQILSKRDTLPLLIGINEHLDKRISEVLK